MAAALLVPCLTPAPPVSAQQKRLHFGIVFQQLNDFAQVIAQGAKDAGETYDVDVDVVGSGQADAQEAIGQFEALVQSKVDGLAVQALAGDTWTTPINEAVDGGIPVLTINADAAKAKRLAFFSEDGHNTGRQLATNTLSVLKAKGVTSGDLVVGNCFPAAQILQDRFDGFVAGLKEGGAGFNIVSGNYYDVKVPDSDNYANWENLATANPQTVAMVGLCSMDIPNLARLKTRTNGGWQVVGYDLNIPTLDALDNGTAAFTIGQHPYLQGYLPIKAFVEHYRNNKDLPTGHVDTGIELVYPDQVKAVRRRESDKVFEFGWYNAYISLQFADINKHASAMAQ